ncbi:MAG: hypothetical protein U1B84_15055 [Variovorax sp.]|nr:hypothetical protein [Variovorax sp.]
MQLRVGPKRTLSAPQPLATPEHRPGERGAVPRSQARKVHPTRLSHVLLFTQCATRRQPPNSGHAELTINEPCRSEKN